MTKRFALSVLCVLAGTMNLLPAYALDYPIECSGVSADAEIDAAIALAASEPVRAVLSAGTCVIQSAHVLNGAVSFSIEGAGAASTIVQGQGIAIPMFRVGITTGGVDFVVRFLTLRAAPLSAIVIRDSAMRLDGVQVSDNKGGTAIVSESSNIAIANSRFEGNAGDQGSIAAYSGPNYHLNVVDTTFVNNSSTQNGGAINANVSVDLDRVLFTGNSANNGYGGAIQMYEIAFSIRNTTFSGNSAAFGGGVAMTANFATPGVTLRNVTMHGDIGTTAGSEIYLDGSSSPPIAIFNSLIGGTCAGPSIVSTAHGSIESPGDTCGMAGAGNQVSVAGADLHLGTLADNGGATLTLYPNPGSVLIDAADADCESVDQRGFVRNVGPCDVGAVEAAATLTDQLFADDFER